MNTDWVETPFDIVRVAHVELVVTDLAASREFYVDVLGLVPTEEADDAIYLRGYEERLHHSLVLRAGPA
ncbi:MAG TPA: VOC family protein, partial [Gaiellaceae bacterium]|nr:VOC family protein [Gaiellaceae bacterium]